MSAAESSAAESFAAEVSAVVRSGRTSTAEVRPRRTVIFGKYFLAGNLGGGTIPRRTPIVRYRSAPYILCSTNG